MSDFDFPTEEHIVGALMYLYSFQTRDEKMMKGTAHANSMGFNSADAGILTSMAQFYEQRGFLTPKQLKYASSILGKYHRQLSGGDWGPLPLKKAETQARPQAYKRAELKNDLIHIKFSYNPDLVEMVKRFEGRRWNSKTKTWTAPISKLAVESLMGAGFEMDQAITREYEKMQPREVTIQEIPGLRVPPYPFQMEGVEFVERMHGRALIGDDMGLGKTMQALAWLQLHPEARPAVVVCPASMKESWARSAHNWMTGETIITLSGRPESWRDIEKAHTLQCPGDENMTGPIYVVNYDVFANKIVTKEVQNRDGQIKKKRVEQEYSGWVDYLLDRNPLALVVDESHYCRNEKTARTAAVRKAAKKIEHMIALSGTPIEKRPVEFWPILNMLKPKQFRNFWRFAKRYCGATKGYFGWDFSGATHKTELNEVLRESVMIRRLKSEVLPDLPPKTRTVVPLTLPDAAMRKYRREEREIQKWMDSPESKDKAAALTRIERLKQVAVEAKMKLALAWIEDFLETGEKLVVFVDHHSTADMVREHFQKSMKVAEVTGQTTGSRQVQVDMFQEDPECRLFLGSKSAVEGLTLTAASNVVFLELFWNSTTHDQAEDRVNRIGQEAQNIGAWYLLAADTIEEEIAALIDQKQKILKAVLDGKETKDFDLLTVLIERMSGRKEAS